jgi:hypothetical protein
MAASAIFGIDVASCVFKAGTGSIMIPLRLRLWLSGSELLCWLH